MEISGLTNEQYHARSEYSSSQLKVAIDDKKLFHKTYIEKSIESTKSSSAFKIGTLFHEMILEPELFNPTVYPFDRMDKRTKAYKDWIEDNDVCPDEIISKSDMSKLEKMKQSFEANAEAVQMIKDADKIEKSYTYKDEGIELRVRPDALSTVGKYIVDLKTTSNPVNKRSFTSDVLKYKYHLSAMMYYKGLLSNTIDAPNFYWIVTQTVEPHSTVIYKCGEKLGLKGMDLYFDGLESIKSVKSGSTEIQDCAEIIDLY